MKRIVTFAALIFSLFFINSCKKEKSLEGFGVPAKGSLQSDSNGDCLPKTVSGVYEAGKGLTNAEFIKVDVNVTAVGTYSITTDTVNGYFFKGTGFFTTTGINTIQLNGVGIPQTKGVNNFTVTFDGTTCFIPVTVLPAGAGGPAVFTLQGAGGTCTAFAIGGSYILGTALNSSNTVTITANVTTIGTYNITTTAANGMTFSAGSVFAATGPQTITLVGTGTPVAATPTTVTVTAGGGNCTFVINITSAAVFTFVCASAMDNGTYEAGVALTPANTIDIDVDVTTAGSYSITTTAVNGITFSGSGILAAGPQTITLKGSGIPTAAGTFNIPIAFLTSNCPFPLIIDPGMVIEWKFTEGVNTYQGVKNIAVLSVISGKTVFGFTGSNANSNNFTISISDITGGIQVNETYTTSAAPATANSGSFIFMGNTNSVTYNSDPNKAGTSIIYTITTHNPAAKTISGTFSGTVLNEANVLKTISNGEFRGTYQ
jgi:hypothetical protein